MRNIVTRSFWKFFTAICIFCFQIGFCLAQDSQGGNSATTEKTTTTTTHTEWYTIPWVWIVTGIILILLLVAIFSGRRPSSRTTITNTDTGRTITTETDEV